MSKVLRRSDASLAFQILCDRQYRETVRDLSLRIAEYLGYPEDDAGGVAASVDTMVGRFLEGVSSDDPTANVEVAFSTGATAVETWIRYRGQAVDPDAALELERAIRGETAPGGALASIRETVDGLKIGREDDATFCCLTRALPPDA